MRRKVGAAATAKPGYNHDSTFRQVFMTILDAILLGIIQGLTEFIPISSTAHLRVIPALLGKDDPGAAFTAVIQWGTVLAALIYFRKDVWRIARATLAELFTLKLCRTQDGKMGWMILAGTVPIVVAGLLFEKRIKNELRSLYVISAAAIALALALVVAEWLVRRHARLGKKQKEMGDIGWWESLGMGLAQVAALIPGASRSGVTITAGLFQGMSRPTAARFSFLLGLPAIFGAGVHQLYSDWKELAGTSENLANLIVCTVVSGIVGYASIAFLLTYLKTHSTYLFIVYRIALGLALLALLGAGVLNPEDDKKDGNEAAASRLFERSREGIDLGDDQSRLGNLGHVDGGGRRFESCHRVHTGLHHRLLEDVAPQGEAEALVDDERANQHGQDVVQLPGGNQIIVNAQVEKEGTHLHEEEQASLVHQPRRVILESEVLVPEKLDGQADNERRWIGQPLIHAEDANKHNQAEEVRNRRQAANDPAA
jgi:undecaprenyl-diphosphatase